MTESEKESVLAAVAMVQAQMESIKQEAIEEIDSAIEALESVRSQLSSDLESPEESKIEAIAPELRLSIEDLREIAASSAWASLRRVVESIFDLLPRLRGDLSGISAKAKAVCKHVAALNR